MGDDWMMEEEPAEVAAIVETRPGHRAMSPAEKRHELMKGIEDEILLESSSIVRDALRGRDIEPGQDKPPEEWAVADPKEAAKMLRMANYALLPKKDAPVLLDIAMSQMLGIIKARATEQSGDRTLQMTFVQVPRPAVLDELPELEVSTEDK